MTSSSALWLLSIPLLPTSVLAVELSDLIDPLAKVEKVVGDCVFTEGPAWSPKGFLLFSDIPNSRILKVLPDGSSSVFLKSSGRSNGLMFDAAGTLYACQGASAGGERRVARIDAKSGKAVAVATHFDGKRLNSPNDLALDAHGGIWFTDPRYGGNGGRELDVMGVYWVKATGGKVSRLIDDLERPNGVLVSPDGKHLYVAEPNRRQIYRYDITAPGKISGKKLFYTGDAEKDGGGPDGMAHDVHGNLYATY